MDREIKIQKLIESLSKRLNRPVSRREFLQIAGAFLATSATATAKPETAKSPPATTRPTKTKPGFAGRYRGKINYDNVTISTHNINCWFQQNCAFHVFTKDGKVVREEQVADYPQETPHTPDFNPRGCQKGCSYSSMMYNEARVQTPLKRAGKRGSGKWQQVSWDQALDEIADKIIKSIREVNTQSIVVDPGGTGMVSHTTFYSMFRFFEYLDSVLLDINTELGDDQQGAAVTYGEIAGDRSGGDYFYADLILIWGGNPAYTQIPNFHFLTEARYNGTKVISIAPDLNASAIHADLWFPVKPGTDAALANGMAHVMLKEGLYDKKLIQEQTDLPFLVRVDNNKLLRESDIESGGSREVTYRWDKKQNKPVAADVSSLELNGLEPALEGTFRVKTRSGRILVRPVFEVLKEKLAKFTPEYASKVCGIAPENIKLLARELCRAKAATNVCTSSISKFYHGDIMQRAMILTFLLAGQLGKKGAGFVSVSFLVADGSNKIILESEVAKEKRLDFMLDKGPEFWENLMRRDMHSAQFRYGVDIFNASQIFTNSTLYWNTHGGLFDISGQTNKWDPHVKEPLFTYIDPVLENVFHIDKDKKPKIFFACGGNLLRRLRGSQKLIEELWPTLDLVVTLDLRLSTTAMFSDFVLPVSGAYEKTTSMVANSNTVVPYLHTTQKAVGNVGQAKDEWEIFCLLAKKIQEKAEALEDTSFTTRLGEERYFDRMYDFLSFDFDESDHEAITKDFINSSTNLAGDFDDIKEKGYVAFESLGEAPSNWGNATDITAGETITPYTWHTENKTPWFTLTGRVQFYHDHDLYLELNEQLPIHKDPIKAGGNYPLVLTGGHARWSIHGQWRTDPTLLRLQRGEPCLYISFKDAKKRGIKDDDRIKVYNDVGHFITRAKLSTKPQPGQVIMYHAWESFQFENWQGYRNVLASPINPIEMAADEIYLRPTLAQKQPGQSDRDTRVQVKRL